MRPDDHDSDSNSEPVTESAFRANRFLFALLVALGLCLTGFSVCFTALLAFNPPELALARSVDAMRWVFPVLMILVLPGVLAVVEQQQKKKRVSARTLLSPEKIHRK